MTTLHQHTTLFLAQIGPSGPTAPPGAAKFNTLAAWVMWGVVLLLVVAAMAAAGKLAWDSSGRGGGGGGEGATQLGKVAVAAIVVASAVAIVNLLVLP